MRAVFSNFCGTSVVPQQQTAQGHVRVDFSDSNPPVLSEEFDFIANETVAQFRKRVERRVNRLGGAFVLHVTKRNKPKREFLFETEIIREKYVYCLVNSVPSPAPAARSVRVHFLGVIPPIPPEEFDFIHGETGVELLHRALKRVNHYGGTLIGDKAFMRDQIIQENQEYSIYGSSPLQAAKFPVQVIWTKPPYSASRVQNQCPWFHEPFSHILPSDGYIPNRRLAELQTANNTDPIIVERIRQEILESCSVFNSFRTETEVEDSNLNLLFQKLQQILPDVLEIKGQLAANTSLSFGAQRALPSGDIYLAQSCRPQPIIRARISESVDVILMGSEAKGIEASLEYCRCQLLTVCGSGAIKLRRIGLKLEDAVTVGVTHAGNCFQFFGFYLVEPSFPVTVALTRVYNISSSNDDVNEVAIWFARCLDLVVDVAQLAGNQGLVTQDISDVRINGDGYFFFKPIRSSQELRCQEFTPSGKSSFQLRLNQFMRVYMRIDDLNRRNGNISDFVDFPLGAITVPDTDTKNDDRTIDTSLQQFAKGLKALVWRHFPMFDLLDSRPLIIFPQLNATDWHNTRPNKAVEQKYLSALCEAIDFLNNAEVAHLDLRPANIMWTVANGNMKIKVIDFEDAVIFGNTILQSFIDLTSGIEDYRYPFNPAGKLSTIAAVEHNAYFAHCITAWLEKSAEPLDFDGFMMRTSQEGGRNAAQSFFRR